MQTLHDEVDSYQWDIIHIIHNSTTKICYKSCKKHDENNNYNIKLWVLETALKKIHNFHALEYEQFMYKWNSKINAY